MTQFEFGCMIINKTCALGEGSQPHTRGKWLVHWVEEIATPATTPAATEWQDTPQAAWRAAFAMLDRRKREQDRRQK